MKKIGYLTQLMLISLLPLVITAVVLCVFSAFRLKASLEEGAYDQLKVAAEGLDSYYAWDIINLGEPTYEHDYVDSLKEQDIELTLFMGDTRFITSIVDQDNKRIEGTKANEDIYKKVLEGEDYYNSGVKIGDNEYYVYYTPVMDGYKKVVGMAFAGMPQEVVTKHIDKSLQGLLFVSLIILVISSVTVIVVSIRIKKPIAMISKTTSSLATGNLGVEIDAKSAIKEIDVLIKADEELKNNFNDVISLVNGKSEELAGNVADITEGIGASTTAAGEIVKVVGDLAGSTESMAQSVQNTVVTMNDFGRDITSISELVESADKSSEEGLNISREAKNNLDSLIRANKNTYSISNDIIKGINESSQAVDEISKAIEAISNIASQTNLLSLNASIEAARAGEAGKGFAVVASSIQDLADQSDKSTKEIQIVIENIVRKSEHNVTLAGLIKEAVDNEGTVLEEVSTSFEDVDSKINETAHAVENIKIKAEELDKNKDVVLDEINNLSALSQENATSCEETTASMEDLNENIEIINKKIGNAKKIAQSLQESVTYFKL